MIDRKIANKKFIDRRIENYIAPADSKQEGGICPPGIWNSMFLPLMKKDVRGGGSKGVDTNTSLY